jgi:hypothetical protein
MNFREARGYQSRWENTGLPTGFSNFQFVDQHYGSDPVLRRIFSQARKHDYQSVLVEEVREADCALLAEENQALAVRSPDFQKAEVHRISFFRSSSDKAPRPEDFLGYAIFKWDHFGKESKPLACVFEAVMCPCRGVIQNNFIHCARRYEVNTTLGRFPVRGVIYAKQNNLTFVCAHAALRSALACVLPEGDISYARMNALAGIDHKSRCVGPVGDKTNGLSPQDLEKILDDLGVPYDKLIHEPKLVDPATGKPLIFPTEYQRELYGFIESGGPALLAFELDPRPGEPGEPSRHAVPAFGHTFNEDAWLPNAQRAYFGGAEAYYPSENWLSNFVIHDDNFGPYFCLPRHFLKQDNFRLMYGLKSAPTTFRATTAEAIGFNLCYIIAQTYPKRNQFWYDRFSVFARSGWLVLRTLLLRRDVYLADLEQMRDREGASLENDFCQRLRNVLPAYFWMVEIGAPELYATTRRKFGEILVAADKPAPPPFSPSLFLAARLPGLVLVNAGTGSLDVGPSQLRGHTPLFTSAKQPQACT